MRSLKNGYFKAFSDPIIPECTRVVRSEYKQNSLYDSVLSNLTLIIEWFTSFLLYSQDQSAQILSLREYSDIFTQSFGFSK